MNINDYLIDENGNRFFKKPDMWHLWHFKDVEAGPCNVGTVHSVKMAIASCAGITEFIILESYDLTDDIGKVAVIFNKILSSEQLEEINDAIYNTMPVIVFCRAFMVEPEIFHKQIEHIKSIT
jgi:hypothetical protein